jgi:CxxC motif-containing protein (DUF1111 family)
MSHTDAKRHCAEGLFIGSAILWAGLASSILCGCGVDDPLPPQPDSRARIDLFDSPIAGLDAQTSAVFNDGDLAFSSPLREADGLGPLYTRESCGACHASALRGPGLVQKMAVVQADGVTPAADQSELRWGHTVHPLKTAGAVTAILAPQEPNVKISIRVGPPVLGRGYMEAIADADIERVAAEQAARGGAVHGRVNRVVYSSEPAGEDTAFNPHQKGDVVIGRFGLKARIATLDEFTADAFQGDMGITNPWRPSEFPNPDGLTDDGKPGVDVEYDSVEKRAMYLRLLAIPERYTDTRGTELFARVSCSSCHVTTYKTRADYPIPKLAGVKAPIYTDLLVHSMGSELADGLPAAGDTDGSAGSFEWRTAPLIGLRFYRTFLHDGRAKSIREAIEMHRGTGSEANDVIGEFSALSAADQQALVDFVQAL